MKKLIIMVVGLMVLLVFSLPETTNAAGHDQAVYQLQERLKGLGYAPGAVDGIWGRKTQKALERFQIDNALPVSGQLDEATKEKLGLKEKPRPSFSSTNISEPIIDSATLKLIILDLNYNLLGIGWEDREKFGVGQNIYVEPVKKITSKYGIDMASITGRKDVGESTGYYNPQKSVISFFVSEEWSEIVHLDNSARLPTIKFRNGLIKLYLNPISIYFDENIECMIDGKKYVYSKGNWVGETTDQNTFDGGLLEAAIEGDLPNVKALLAKGADVNEKSESGLTSLIVASINGHNATVQLLLDNGADVNGKDNNDITALMAATNKGHIEIIKVLLASKSDVNAKDKHGRTALHFATFVRKENANIVKLLLAHEANVNARSDDGITPLMAAALNGHTSTVQVLLEKGADVNVKADAGWSALMAARKKGHNEIIRLLIQAGASE